NGNWRFVEVPEAGGAALAHLDATGAALVDLDGDGDLDLIGTRGNSGEFDGLFWLEQIRTRQPRKAYEPARAKESAALPLPAADRR
ncbi:MAG: hypothetical protein JNL62_26020, partial [Bryobacterales bacterium]|nr:hypothetical protein [Bryobacterales bacterium]